jgi:geranylgeranyl pyrophosphate synthase
MQHPTDQSIILEAIKIIKESKSIEYAVAKAKELVQNAWKDVESQLPNNEAKNKLHAFSIYLIERTI